MFCRVRQFHRRIGHVPGALLPYGELGLDRKLAIQMLYVNGEGIAKDGG